MQYTVIIITPPSIMVVYVVKAEVKISLLLDDMMLYTNDSKKCHQGTFPMINIFSKVTGYKMNSQKFSSPSVYK